MLQAARKNSEKRKKLSIAIRIKYAICKREGKSRGETDSLQNLSEGTLGFSANRHGSGKAVNIIIRPQL
jgi:hypothetical protein